MSKEDYTIPIRKYTELGEVTVKECVLKEEYDKLQDRIDKAIEYIGYSKEISNPQDYIKFERKLLEILKGDSE